MKERPILFSGPMVRAILDGCKTQTRRVINPQIPVPQSCGPGDFLLVDEFGDETVKQSPFGAPGDRLWVRETFVVDYEVGEGTRGGVPPAVFYRATDDGKTNFTPGMEHWKPSIHMPRMYCRLLLDVKAVRVERLQEITEEDATAEGVDAISLADAPRQATWSRRQDYAQLWDSLNKKRGFGWDTNPWVWVIEFERVQPEHTQSEGK